MEVSLAGVERLRFADGSPVRAASAVTRFEDGHLVAQDDATHAAWLRDGVATRLRLLPPVEGLDVFDEATGTKHLKPDLEAAVTVEVDGSPGVVLLGSGSSPARMRSVLVRSGSTGTGGGSRAGPRVVVADLTPAYAVIAEALGVTADELNLEGACVIGDALRWYHRGLPSAGLPSASVDLELAAVLSAVLGVGDAAEVGVGDVRRYDLGEVDGIGLAVTDATALPGGAVLVSAAAEDAPNARDDGPVVGSALVLLEGQDVVDLVELPRVEGEVCKVEGISVLDADATGASLLAVVDADDATAASLVVRLRVGW